MIIKTNKIKAMGVTALWAGALAAGIVAAGMLAGCYIPGLGAAGTASDLPANGDPGGVADTFYGKFMMYEVADGKIGTLNGARVNYILGDTYYPTADVMASDEAIADYNILHRGNGLDNPGQTILYTDTGGGIAPLVPSTRPEAILTPPGMALYYTNHTFGINLLADTELACGIFGFPNEMPNTVPPSDYQFLAPGFYPRGLFNNQPGVPDADVYTLDVRDGSTLPGDGHFFVTPGTLVVFRLQFQVFTGIHSGSIGSPSYDVKRQPKLSLYDPAGNQLLSPNGTLIESRNSADYWRYQDAQITHVFRTTGFFYLKVEDINNYPCTGTKDADSYVLSVESPSFNLATNHIMKGEIQPARSGNPTFNPLYDGGYSFEPDDFSTKVQDLFPVCNSLPGVPDSGGAGDAGLSENCNAPNDYGAHDGTMQYQEVDNKAAIDDGEYFVGKPTNLGTTMDAEASLIKTPLANTLTMFVNFGNRIYMLESLDGFAGLQWDLTNIIEDKPAVTPRQQRAPAYPGQVVGSPVSPVISSGALGFCETAPGAGDVSATPELQSYAEQGGTVATASGTAVLYPSAYPNTLGVTFGGNKHLDSLPLQDTLAVRPDGSAGNTITSGPDGIINTFFAPKYIAYGRVANAISNQASPVDITPTDDRGFHGPGNSDNPRLFDSSFPGWTFPLAGPPFNGDNRTAYLFNDDQWNPALFPQGDTVSPAAYMARQHCDFYNFGTMFDKCAMGAPVGPDGKEPVAIAAGGDGRLNTTEDMLWSYHGDDRLCATGHGDSVAICPGPDGKFGVPDIYAPIKGDDVLAVVFNPAHTANDYYPTVQGLRTLEILEVVFGSLPPGNLASILATPLGGDTVIGIAPGPNHILDTPIMDSYTVVDVINNRIVFGGDHYCLQTLADGSTFNAICPGLEINLSAFDLISGTVGESRRLMSDWSMYLTSPARLGLVGASALMNNWLQMKQDDYDLFDDNFCVVAGKPAICPGPNGYFQSYPISQRLLVAQNDDLFTLYQDVADLVGQPCFIMTAESYRKTPANDPTTRFVLYRYFGVRGDDRVRWDPARGGYIITTGANGINQSCVAPMDVLHIPFNHGLPYQPIITAGGDGALQTYPLKDYDVQPGANLHKISTGPDGVANSFLMGDDKAEIFFGTGRPDYPCVLSGPDGMAGTTVEDFRKDPTAPLNANDNQLYDPGSITGFDAFQVWGPDAVVLGNNIYLYYTALGFERVPDTTRPDSGSLGSLGECKRPGLDKEWGKYERDTNWALRSGDASRLYRFNNYLAEYEFEFAVDNNQGVELAPRIGLATSDIFRLRNNPSDWTFNDQPALDMGKVCAGNFDFPIDLGDAISFGGVPSDVNWVGAYSPDMLVAKAPDDDHPLFLMFFTGITQSESPDNLPIPSTQIGLARSMDGLHFEFVRQSQPLISKPELDLSAIIGGSGSLYANGTVAPAGNDEWGEPMYGMFFNEYESSLGKPPGATPSELDMIPKNHIGYAIRRGKITLGCNLGAPAGIGDRSHLRLPLQVLIIAVPLLLILAVRIFRRQTV